MNEIISRCLSNFLTTAIGIIGGSINYLLQVGAKPPQTNAEWGQLAFSALIAGLGAVAKDATTGSKPGGNLPPSQPQVIKQVGEINKSE